MSAAEIRRNQRRLRLSIENLGAIKELRALQFEWRACPLNAFVNHLIADGIRVRFLAIGKAPPNIEVQNHRRAYVVEAA